jgi:hypothetical protein
MWTVEESLTTASGPLIATLEPKNNDVVSGAWSSACCAHVLPLLAKT